MASFGLVLTAIAFAAAFTTACATDVSERSSLTNGRGGDDDDRAAASQESSLTGGANLEVPPGTTAKQLFTQAVQPELAKACGTCHAVGPGPAWIVPNDIEKSYAFMFNRGYVVTSSALIKKGPHAGGAPALTNPQATVVQQWIGLELKERGEKAPPSILEKLGDCLDKEKFEAIGLDKLRTVTRNAQNNPNKQVENANECTGCKPVECSACHSADPGTGFIMAIGNTLLPDDTTFLQTKSTAPPYLQKYFGLDPNGTPVPSKVLKQKSDATVAAKAYTHPMYTLPKATETALDAFVADAIAKYTAGSCGK